MTDNKTYTCEEILDLVQQSANLNDMQKHVIRAYIDSALQAAFNAATNQYQGYSYVQPRGDLGDDKGIDLWEVFFNQMMQTISLGNLLEKV